MRFLATTLVLALLSSPGHASPWAEAGDNALRADVALLSSAGVLSGVTTQWALPWDGLLGDIANAPQGSQSIAVRAAAARVLARGRGETASGFSGTLSVTATNTPSIIYGFDGLGRGEGQAQLSLAYASGGTAARISMGAFSTDYTGQSIKFMPDGTFIAQVIGDDTLVYAGWLSHWWGPGWISALTLSNNARPMPQVGVQRISSEASSWPMLEWLGPWRAEFFVGLMDDPRMDRNTVYNALRLAFKPVQELEIAIGRTEQLCGESHTCVPLRDTLHFMNDPANPNFTNAQGQIDILWTPHLLGAPWQFYTSLMNEDSSPFVDSGTTHLFGATVFVPMAQGTPLRLTLEYTDSVPTRHLFSFGNVQHGFSYNNNGYPDGMRYRGRTLGFSLDSDSRLLSLQGAWSSDAGWFYELAIHNAHVSNPNNLRPNVVTAMPVRINMAEARMGIPLGGARLDMALRLQDDQPRPARGFDAGLEVALRAPL